MSFKVKFLNQEKEFNEKVRIMDLIDNSDKKIICCRVNNRLKELTYYVDEDCKIEFLTLEDADAGRIYEATARFIAVMAFRKIYPELDIRLSRHVSRATFLQILNKGVSVNKKMRDAIEAEMKRIIDADLPLVRASYDKAEAAEIYKRMGLVDKLEALAYRPESKVHLYECEGYYNYLASRMTPSTGFIKNFKLNLYVPGLILQTPRSECNGEIPEFVDAPTYGRTLQDAHDFAKLVNADTVVKVNEHIHRDGVIDFIQLCEARHNRMLCELGEIIENNDDIKIICIAGPSSSGKTTFANRVRIELMQRGLKPIRISMDDYYLTKDKAPKDEDGNPDLESIEALDIDLFNQNMLDLINGEEVQLPKFDFKLGKRVPGRVLKVGKGEPIIIEGIHALNDRMTCLIPRHQKFKIFIAPQMQINLDNHCPISTVDLRLLRRLVRDKQFRGASAEETIGMWPSVRRGEFKWIYETQEGADFVYNSMLPYELCVMKKYAQPLLEAVDINSEYFPVAERLLRMLKYFDDMPDQWVPCNSLMREFIGGSCYAD
ncbi:MAG: nucleoside kinase [Bacilli bacterium]|jgi:uridine kinase|nr:nucleoside kinase [Bacilli bacterium]